MVRVVTVATHDCDGLERFRRSCPGAVVLGLDSDRSYDMSYPGGGFKVNLLKRFIESCENDHEMILFTDSFDAIIKNLNFRIDPFVVLFSAEVYCWPDSSLAKEYPQTLTPFRFLNSGGFLGSVGLLREILKFGDISDAEDDQLFYTRAFLSQRYNIQLDTQCNVFQTFNGAQRYIRLAGDRVYNAVTGTYPLVLHGNGSDKNFFNRVCDHVMSVGPDSMFEVPSVLVAFDEPSCVVPLSHEARLLSVTFLKPEHPDSPAVDRCLEYVSVEDNRLRVLAMAEELDFDAVLFVSSEHRLSRLSDLCMTDKKLVAPLLVREGTLFSNFWGALSRSGYYERSWDYVDILNRNIVGVWNVPYVNETFLVKKELFHTMRAAYEHRDDMDRDMRVCKYLRSHGTFMYLDNRYKYGTIV